jgi:hypothetical protein
MISDRKRQALAQILSGYYTNDQITTSEAVAGVLGLLEEDTGKTLRDEFAMAAMQGLFAGNSDEFWVDVSREDLKTHTHAYKWADRMLEARK